MLRILNLTVVVEDNPDSSDTQIDKFKRELKPLLSRHFSEEGKVVLSDTQDMYRISREPKIYWFKGSRSKKDILIFDAGHENGNVHLYELRESYDEKKLDALLENHGHSLNWRITEE